MAEQKKENQSGTGMAQALSEAQSIIQAAEQRAQELQSRAEASYQKAKDEGFEQGFREGLEEASRQAVRLIQDSTSIADRLAEEAAKLALAISSSVIKEQIALEPQIVKRIALEAIQESVVGDTVVVTVNPDDKEVLEASLADLRRLAGSAGVTIETNQSLGRGGCIVKTDFGEVDASIETLLDSLRERLQLE